MQTFSYICSRKLWLDVPCKIVSKGTIFSRSKINKKQPLKQMTDAEECFKHVTFRYFHRVVITPRKSSMIVRLYLDRYSALPILGHTIDTIYVFINVEIWINVKLSSGFLSDFLHTLLNTEVIVNWFTVSAYDLISLSIVSENIFYCIISYDNGKLRDIIQILYMRWLFNKTRTRKEIYNT